MMMTLTLPLEILRPLLPLWEKVSPSDLRSKDEIRRRMRGVGRIANISAPSNTPHPTSLRSATFSHKGRRQGASS